jgi:broad specificity phosphatase PhoE
MSMKHTLSACLLALSVSRASAFTSSIVVVRRHASFGATARSLHIHSMTSSNQQQDAKTNIVSIVGPALPPIPPTSKRLFLVRHGEVINPGGDRPVFYGAMDVPLSPLGEAEARAAGRYLEQFHLEHVVASPLSRAIYGADQVKALQKDASTDVVVIGGFKELDRGAWCGLTKDEIGVDIMARFEACDESVTPAGGGESYSFLKERVLKARDEVLDMTSPGRASAIVSHLQVTRSMLSDALDIPTSEMVGLGVATASVTCIDYDSTTGAKTVQFQSFKPDVGLDKSKDGAN